MQLQTKQAHEILRKAVNGSRIPGNPYIIAFQDSFTGVWGNRYEAFMINTLQTELLTHSVSA